MFFLDSYAIIEIIKDSQSYKQFKEPTLITNALNLAEVHYFLIDFADEQTANETLKNLNFSLIDLTKDIAVEASQFRHKNKKLKLSYADCLGYICAKQNDLKFLTGDDGFKDLENVEFVK